MGRQKFYVVAGNERFVAYKYKDGEYVPQSNEGNLFFSYSVGHIDDGVKKLVEEIANNNNCSVPQKDGDRAEMDFVLVCDSDAVYARTVKESLEKRVYLTETKDASVIVEKLMSIMDDKLTKKHGVNFDGKNYMPGGNGRIAKNKFNLLAKTITASDMINHVE